MRRRAEGRGAAMPRVSQARRQHPMQQDYRRRGVPLMQPAPRLRNAGMLAAVLIMLAAAACPALAQATAPENLVDALAGLETAPEIDIAAIRQQALERPKSKATAQPVNRPALVPELL